MTITNHLQDLHGLPVFDFPEDPAKKKLPSPGSVAWRVAVEPYEAEETWPEAFARFLAAVDTTSVRALVVGPWGEGDESSTTVVEEIVKAKDRLPALRAIFLGDITYEENEISWICQCDVSPLLEHFPALEELGVRGGQDLVFPPVTHHMLRSLSVETGGLGASVVRGIAASNFPALRQLELWLGVSWYGGDATVADLEPILSGVRLPELTYLGLRNSEIQDEVAAAVAAAPVVARLSILDLSMGTLGDEGAEALLSGQPLTHLQTLDLHHHFLSEAMCKRLTESLEPAGVRVDLSEAEGRGGDEDDDERDRRYTAVSE